MRISFLSIIRFLSFSFHRKQFDWLEFFCIFRIEIQFPNWLLDPVIKIDICNKIVPCILLVNKKEANNYCEIVTM